jgi:ankyrin repeat protein
LLRLDPSAANSRDEHGSPLLAYAHTELERQADMIALLIAHGADVNARFADGTTLLDRALSRGLVDYAELLRSHGARQAAS